MGTRIISLGVFFAVSLLALACSGGGGDGDDSTTSSDAQQMDQIEIKVDLAQVSSAQRSKALGSIEDVDTVTGDISSSEGVLLRSFSFQKIDASVWKVEVDSLPLKQSLVLIVKAMNSSNTVLFSGSSSFQANSEDFLSISVPIQPIDDLLDNHPPVINTVTIPSEIATDSTIQLQVLSRDEDNDMLTYLWEVEGGSIIGSAMTDSLSWHSPGENDLSGVTLTVFDGIDQTKIHFELQVGYQGQRSIQLIFLPVILGFDAEWTIDNSLQIQARIDSDDTQQLVYRWFNDNDELLSSEKIVTLSASQQVLSAGLRLEVGYDGIDTKVSVRYLLESQNIPTVGSK